MINNMTFTIGYPIYNKGHMLDEIVSGLVYSIDQNKYDIKYKFIFDGCTDDSKEVFEKERIKLKNIETIDTSNLFQLRTNNILIKNFDTDFLIIFQDDMVLRDPKFLDNILKVYEIYGDKLGIIGCRDGFDETLSNMYGSEFSGSYQFGELYGGRRIVLKSGEYKEKMMINIGPIIFTKKLVEKMGCFDETYDCGGLEEMEYSLKCTLEGLKTIVMGVDLIHSKFNHKNTKHVVHTSSDVLNAMYPRNGAIFKERWNNIAKLK